jgi:hypothetical protein
MLRVFPQSIRYISLRPSFILVHFALAYMINLLDIAIPLGILLLAVIIDAYLRRKRLLAVVPPSLKPLPLIGNILSIPSKAPWKTYAAWGKELSSKSLSF